MTHTPGPWTLDDEFRVYAAGDRELATLCLVSDLFFNHDLSAHNELFENEKDRPTPEQMRAAITNDAKSFLACLGVSPATTAHDALVEWLVDDFFRRL
jgi:hypothetical protein